MVWTLSRAVLRCQTRRLTAAAAIAPVPAALAVAAVLAAPLLLARAGNLLGRELGLAVTEPHVARSLVLGLLATGAVAGFVLAGSSSAPASLGPQLGAAPLGSSVAVIACVIVPAGVIGLALTFVCCALTVPLAGSTRAGAGSGVALAVVPIAAAPAGAVAAELLLAVVRRRPATLGAGVAMLAAWSGSGALLGSAVLGPLAPVAAALEGDRAAELAVASAALAGTVLTITWAGLAAHRPEPPDRADRRRLLLVRGRGRTAVPAALWALLVRRGDVRLAAVAATAFGLGGIAIAELSHTEPPAGLYLGATSALLAAALAPLAMPGIVLAGRWLWATAPGPRLEPAAAASGVSFLAAAGPVCLVGAVGAAVSGAPGPVLASLAVLICIGAAVAQIAGTLVPWRGRGAGEQLACVGALGGCGAAATVVVTLSGPRLVAAGCSNAQAALVLVVAAWLTALAAIRLATGRKL